MVRPRAREAVARGDLAFCVWLCEGRRVGGREGGKEPGSPLCCDDQAIQLGREMKRRNGLTEMGGRGRKKRVSQVRNSNR